MNIDTPNGMLAACVWTQALIDNMKDGGRWDIPRSRCIVTFNKKDHTFTMTGEGVDTATCRVMEALGWQES